MPLRRRYFAPSTPAAFVERLEDRTLLAAAGSLDPTFGIGGKVTTALDGFDFGYALAVQADGKVLVAGKTSADRLNYDFALVRYSPDGTLDTSFGTGGVVTTDFAGGHDVAWEVAVQADGKIVAAGQSRPGPTGDDDFALARYNADGSLDTTFGIGGKVTTDFEGFSDAGYDLAIQADGKIVVAGEAFTGALTFDFALARYNPNGTLDVSFGAAGKVVTDTNAGARALAIQADGKLVAAGALAAEQEGAMSTGFALVRYNPDGWLDAGFGAGGIVTTVIADGAAEDVAIQADGKIVVAGSADEGDTFSDFAVARYNPDGSLDAGFGASGVVTTDIAGDSDHASTVAIQADGKVVVAGEAFVGGPTDFDLTLVRYNPDGTLDRLFGRDGKVTTDFAGNTDFAHDVAILADGSILAAGTAFMGATTGPDFALARYRAVARPGDLAGFTADEDWYIAASNGTSFTTTHAASWSPDAGWRDLLSGDFDGDGLTDVAGRTAAGGWWVGRNTGSGFEAARWGGWNPDAGWQDVRALDVDGDGKTDIAGRAVSGRWWVSQSTGGASSEVLLWGYWAPQADWRDVLVLDVNGDGRSDVAGRAASGRWWVSLSGGTSSEAIVFGSWVESAGWRDVTAGDFNGDGQSDIAGRAASGRWWVSLSEGTSSQPTFWGYWVPEAGWEQVLNGDFDGDGDSDLLGRAASGDWWFAQSSGSALDTTHWGPVEGTDRWRDARVGEFDSDSAAEIAGRDAEGRWIVLQAVAQEKVDQSGQVIRVYVPVASLWGTWDESLEWQRVLAGEFAA